MYKLCKTEQSAARQRELEEGLLNIMLSRHYDEISVSELCDQLNVPRKSFYRYFSGKDGALHALIDHTLLEYEGFQIVLVTRSIDHALSDVGMPHRFLHQKERAARQHATMFGVCGLMSMILDWHHRGYDLSARQMSEIAVKLLTEPLFSDLNAK